MYFPDVPLSSSLVASVQSASRCPSGIHVHAHLFPLAVLYRASSGSALTTAGPEPVRRPVVLSRKTGEQGDEIRRLTSLWVVQGIDNRRGMKGETWTCGAATPCLQLITLKCRALWCGALSSGEGACCCLDISVCRCLWCKYLLMTCLYYCPSVCNLPYHLRINTLKTFQTDQLP